jgi:hypothetical protein
MKNIHLLPTDKPSCKLQKTKHDNFFLSNEIKSYSDCTSQNIYITSDEEIKEKDWCYYENGDLKGIHKVVNGQRPKTMFLKKIILTTDQELISDGVQAIDDEFLEWFVKNPSCEEVEVGTYHVKGDISGKLHYKTIIPESKTSCKCIGGVIICPGCDGKEEYPEFGTCPGCEGVGLVRCGKCGGKETKQEEPKSHIEYTNTDDCTSMIYNQQEEEQLPTKWFKTEQISTWIGKSITRITTEGESIDESEGGHGKLIVMHQCGENKEELISQLETMIYGLKEGFENFAN